MAYTIAMAYIGLAYIIMSLQAGVLAQYTPSTLTGFEGSGRLPRSMSQIWEWDTAHGTHVVMACIAMAYILMACIVMALVRRLGSRLCGTQWQASRWVVAGLRAVGPCQGRA